MQLPVTISNIHGEKLIFERIDKNDKGEDILIVRNEVQPKAGPPMHVHWKQDESLTVTQGRIGYQCMGEEPQYAEVGETVTFYRGTPHKFWNAGEDVLKCEGWITPPNTIVYFLGEIYKSMNEHGGRPGAFDAAYLMDRYKTEYDLYDIPGFVKKVIFPISLFFGKLQGKHKKFANAPEPL
ncbi:MAG: cupin domain-containing protein [Chitinophagaceae bacterium]|nr:cupin domain-containing protein [Chitinophagaceae bacterium]